MNILRVTIGTGGKTPQELQKQEIDNPESIAEGAQYSDSSNQALIYFNQDKNDQLIKVFQEKLYQSSIFDPKIKEEEARSLCSVISSVQEIQQLEELFLNKEYGNFWKEVMRDNNWLTELTNFVKKSGFDLYNALLLLAQAKILNVKN